jgi:hypothetical protein
MMILDRSFFSNSKAGQFNLSARSLFAPKAKSLKRSVRDLADGTLRLAAGFRTRTPLKK